MIVPFVSRLVIMMFVVAVSVSCSEKRDVSSGRSSEPSENSGEIASSEAGERQRESDAEHREDESKPEKDEVAEDCLTFVHATKTGVPKPSSDCPTCPSGGESAEVLKVLGIDVTRVACSGETCEAHASVRATFKPSSHQPITGGLTGWISPEQREQWLRGETPAGEQVYAVKITYRHVRNQWRAIEFDRGE